MLFNLLTSILFAYAGFQDPWGKDAELKYAAPAPAQEPLSLATRTADAIIHFHQQVISPVDGPRSHFRPSSSCYMSLAMHRYGFLQGFLMGCDRLLRENEELWVYRTIQVDGEVFKYDPATLNKYE